MRIGLALHCEIRPSIFHRKNYFYPDMPKDYQVSQYDAPINVNGWLELPDGSRVRIERAHMEEDTGKTSHIGGGGRIHDADYSLVDYNRAGVPLVEIVSAPDIRSSAQARLYASELRGILVATGASDGRMEEGSMRVDANVSVRPAGTFELGTRCEIKNLNSLRSLGPGHRVRDRAPDRRCSRPATRSCSRRGTGTRTRGVDRRPAFEGGGVRLPLLPRARPRARRARRRVAVRGGRVDRAHAGRASRQARRVVRARARRRTARADQIATVVEHGLDELVMAAAGAGVDGALALARTSNEASADPEAARRLDVGASWRCCAWNRTAS